MPQLQLIDEETGATYLFNLTEDELARASTDNEVETRGEEEDSYSEDDFSADERRASSDED